ncbi:MAG: RidA family protein [Alphaproteobacteria bacterium]|nr:RidA family protein [Alphaproteobacteria bacterium]
MAAKRKKKAAPKKSAARKSLAKKRAPARAATSRAVKKVLGSPRPGWPYSPGWRAGDYIYTAGQLGMNAEGKLVGPTIEEQTRACLRRIEAILKEGGAALSDVVKVTTFITDRVNVPGYNLAYGEFFKSNPPARSTVVCDLVVDGLIEIEAVAYKPQ